MKLPPPHPGRHRPAGQLPADPGAPVLSAPRPQSGMALVITLILLSVITFMAIAFLVISRAEKGSVTTTTEQAVARLAADVALERAQAELLAPMMCSGNPYNYSLVVSTNYINTIGFIPGLSHPTNVNYEYTAAHQPLTAAQFLQNLTNLLYDPRPPVYVITNRAFGFSDFRFYLDLNRNGRYDTNGLQPVLSYHPVNRFYNTNGMLMPSMVAGNTVSNFFVGDPEWIGGLEFPDRHYAPDNKFVYRYAYLVVPAGNTLDLNYIHNYAKGQNQFLDYTMPDGFFRNQGVGSWEINLAAFLVDLNTNIWQTNSAPYTYYWNTNLYTQPNRGVAFDDAFSLLRYRYGANRGTLLSAANFFGGTRVTAAFDNDFIDGYSAGPPMVGSWWLGSPVVDADTPRVATYPWSGANNTNRFFTTQELFDPKKNTLYLAPLPGPSSPTFSERLKMAGNGQSSYDRYTFYRLLSQLGTDSAPEVAPPTPKLVTSVTAYGPRDLLATATNHGFFSGDLVTIKAGNPATYQQSFKIQVLDAHTFVMLNPGSFPAPPPGNIVAIDPSENAKIDVNYDNINSPRGTFAAWDSAEFFTAAADRMLRRQNGMFLNNIPVWKVTRDTDPTSNRLWTNNFYTPSLHRLLQLAANMYDAAATNRGVSSYAPTVFRPIFRRNTSNEVFIVGYRQVRNARSLLDERTGGDMIIAELETGLNLDKIPAMGTPFVTITSSEYNEPLVSGVPLIVGAKKGLPNFNEFSMQNVTQVMRRLQFHRPDSPPDAKADSTNQIYVVCITNNFGVEAWNSYATNFSRPLQMITYASLSAEMTNELGMKLLSKRFVYRTTNTYAAFEWPGLQNSATKSFQIPLATNLAFLDFSTYNPVTKRFIPLTNMVQSPASGAFYIPRWWLTLNTRLRFVLVADTTNIIDYVTLNRSEDTLDVCGLLGGPPNAFGYNNNNFWSTNRWHSTANDDRTPTYGILNQILASYGDTSQNVTWKNYVIDPSITASSQQEMNGFYYNLFGHQPPGDRGTYFRSNIFYAPYVPLGTFFSRASWQANDPLVHYTIGDLVNLETTKTNVSNTPDNPALPNLGHVNTRYAPWAYSGSQNPPVGICDLAAKDPLVTSSDAWDFPTNKFPNIGWLGRVHRGTPWQTVYLKSANIDTNAWAKWSGNPVVIQNLGQMDTNILAFNQKTNDAAFTLPVNDRALFDIFTTAFNDNAALGRMSVNQTNLAAWSAVLSGVIALTNTTPGSDLLAGAIPQYAPNAIEPAKVYNPFAASNTFPAVARIVHGINYARSITPSKTFSHLGDILAAPELTVASPFLNGVDDNLRQKGVSDAAYERIPQQILGLLKCDPMPRFVIYAYGQALKPADRSLVTTGPYLGLCTNYQITAEVATRAVVRIEGAPKNPHPVLESFNPLPPD